jgi:anti-sigma regulatory factor (Ser/Thr protein kinase)
MSGSASAIPGHAAAPAANGGESEVSSLVVRLSALDLRPLPTAVPCARLHTRNVLLAWDLADVAENTELVVSEIVTNAIRATLEAAAGAEPLPVRLRLSARTNPGGQVRGVQVEVWDSAGPLPGHRRDAPPDEPGGRGLVLVAALSARWGSYPAGDGGKVVVAAIGREASHG